MSSMEQSEFELVMKRLAEANQRITNLEEEVDRLKSGDDLQARAEQVVEHAERVRQNGEDVTLNYRELAAVTGTSTTVAYRDFERLPELHDAIRKHEGRGGMKLVIGREYSRGEKYNGE